MNIKDSQNFLHSKLLVKQLVQKCNLSNNDIIVEIGPGKGILTNELCQHSKKVIAVEYDKNLYFNLKETILKNNLELHYADFLKFNLPNQNYKVVSNILFNITTDIITKLLENKNPPQEAFLIMQTEAMQKFSGGGKRELKIFNI